MRLAAIFIPPGVLPHIFGKDHIGLTLNLGGEHRYKLLSNNGSIHLVEKVKDNLFIKNFGAIIYH